MNASDNKAVIRLEADKIVYAETGTELWRVPVSSVSVVGEYTTQNGPYVDDYFLVFVTSPGGNHFHASFYAEGRDSLLAELQDKFGATFECGLANSTNLVSRCIWPNELLGKSLFRFTRLPNGGGWKRLRCALSPEYAFDFTDEIQSYLASSKHKIDNPGAAPSGSPSISLGNSGELGGFPSVG
jgi:hypothetical protein